MKANQSVRQEQPASPLKRGSLQGLFDGLSFSTSKSKRKSKPLPLPPSLPMSDGNEAGPLLERPTPPLPAENDVKRICLADERSVFILSFPPTDWKKCETRDECGRKENYFYSTSLQKKLRGCCNESKNIVSCCSLCKVDEWMFQGSQYDPNITLLYARNDGCIPPEVLLTEGKFIIPWRYKNRRTGAVSWKIIHMCGTQIEDAECETIVVNVYRDKKLRRLIEAVKIESAW